MATVLKRFKIDSIKDNAMIACIGKRRSGKSVLMKDIMWHKRHLPIGIAMSPTEKANRYFRDFIPECCIYDDFNLPAVESMLTRQERIAEAWEKGERAGLPSCRNAFIVADDCMYEKKNWKTTAIRNCFMNGRHWALFFMFSMQYCVDIPPDLRSNLDYVFVFRESIAEQKEKLYKYFFGMFKNKQEFTRVFDQTATGFDFMVLDLTQASYAVEDCVFWGRADVRSQTFRVGHPRLWWFAGEFSRHAYAPPPPATSSRIEAPPPTTAASSFSASTSNQRDSSNNTARKRKGVELGLGRDNAVHAKGVIKLGDDEEPDEDTAPPPPSPPRPQPALRRQTSVAVVPSQTYRPPSPFSHRTKRVRFR